MQSRRSMFVALVVIVFFSTGLGIPSSYAGKKPTTQNPADEYGKTIAMSPFEVSAQRMEFDGWIKIGSPHFLMYTDASSKEATKILKQMEMVYEAAQFFFRRKALKLPPVLIVLPTGRSDWKKIGSKGAVEWRVAATLAGTTRELLLVQYDWQADGLGTVWAMLGRQVVNAMNLDGPFWYSHGVSTFFSTASFTSDTLTIGKEGFSGYWIQKYGWMPWPKFFTITGRSPEFVKEGKAHDQFEGQSAVFVHHLLTSADPAAIKRLLGWAAYLDADNEPTEERFKEIFQHDWKSWEKQLEGVMKGGTYTTGQIRFPPAALKFPITTFDLPAREMREIFVLSQILNQNTKDSDASLDTLLARGLKTESLREILADACNRRQRPDAYLTELRTIIDGGSSSPLVYAEAAHTLFKKHIPKISADARLGEEAQEIRTWCNKALELEPLHVNANEILAWTEAFAPEVEKSNLDAIARVCRTLDGNASTDDALAALAVARWRSGGSKQSRALCERLHASLFTGKTARSITEELLARLDAPGAAAPIATGTATAAPVNR